jgi:hypothetical protein
MYYKWEVADNRQNKQNKQGTNQALYVNKKNEQVESSEQSISIGIATSVVYTLMLAYIYGTAFRKSIQFNTFSLSFEKCEKVGTTVLLIVFLALLQGLFASQGMYTKADMKKSLIIAFNYVIITCWLLFMFVFPMHDGKVSLLHSFIAFFVIFCVIINCWLTYALYDEYFTKKDLESMLYSNAIMTALAVIAGIFMITHYFYRSSIKFVAIFELLTLLSYISFNTVFMNLPPIPDATLSCTIIK